ncbi:MAG TPA: hypothetical protein VKU00_06425 [Chthonomonadaceae bacterium]|nr:hypothetical protein [Chthonomonadaceae bacterium]
MVTLPSTQATRGREQKSGRSRRTRETRRLTLEMEREMALERLVNLLAAEAEQNPARAGRDRADSLSRLARLRAIHASYALATSGEMERVGMGAWVRRRYSVKPTN